MISITVPLFVGLFMESKNVISIIGGAEYISGYPTLRVLSIASFFSIVAFYLAQCILIPNSCESKFLQATIASAALNVILNFIIIPFLGHMGAAITTLISEIAVVLMCIHSGKEYCDIKVPSNVLLSSIISSCYIIVVCGIVDVLIRNPFLATLFAVGVSVVGFIVIMLLFKNNSILQLIPRKILSSKLFSNNTNNPK